jgi:hypothetical protein
MSELDYPLKFVLVSLCHKFVNLRFILKTVIDVLNESDLFFFRLFKDLCGCPDKFLNRFLFFTVLVKDVIQVSNEQKVPFYWSAKKKL